MRLNTKSSFSLAVIIFFVLLATPLFITADYCDNLLKKEQTYLVGTIGYDSALSIHDRARANYREIFLDSGIYRSVHHLFIPTEKEQKASKGLENLGQPLFKFIKTQLDVSMKLAYLVIFKLLIFIQYFWFVLLFLVVTALDCCLARKEKRPGFKHFSPAAYRYALAGIFFMSILFLGMFILPVAIEPVVFPGVVIVIGQFSGWFVACLQKQA